MQGALWLHTYTCTSPACVHAVESSDDGSHPSHRSVTSPTGADSSKKARNKVTKILLHLKPISQAFRSLSREAAKNDAADHDKDGGREISDSETFVSANASELRSFSTDDDSELPSSFRLSPLIFPTGSICRPPPPASPVKIIRKLPFGYVIGRQEDAPSLPTTSSSTTLARKIKKAMPLMPVLYLKSRSQMVKKKVVRAVKRTFRRGRAGGEEQDGGGRGDDEDVFWKKDVRGLRCRPVEEDGTLFTEGADACVSS